MEVYEFNELADHKWIRKEDGKIGRQKEGRRHGGCALRPEIVYSFVKVVHGMMIGANGAFLCSADHESIGMLDHRREDYQSTEPFSGDGDELCNYTDVHGSMLRVR